MRTAVSLRLALSFLGMGSRKQESHARKTLYGAIAGIAVSIIPLILVLVVSDGMIEGITSRLVELSSSHIRVMDYYRTSRESGTAADFSQFAYSLVNTNSGGTITHAWGEREGMALVVGKDARSGGTIRAVDPSWFSGENPAMSILETVEGQRLLAGSHDAVLGEKIARDLGLNVGDTFRLLTFKTTDGGRRVPRFTRFTLTGIVSSGYQELDALWVFIPLETGFQILPEESSNTFINVRTSNPFGTIERSRIEVLKMLPDGFRVYTWKDLNRSQFHAFTTTRTLLLFIMFLILFVASVNISSALVMLVMERRKEIAIIKSVGGSPATVSFAFLLAGYFTGFCGILAGLPVGVLCALHVNELLAWLERGINTANRFFHSLAGDSDTMPVQLLDPAFYLENIPVTVRFRELFLVAAGTLVLSVLVSLLPAIRAGREKPLDTLRKF